MSARNVRLHEARVIPAHPLALTSQRRIDERAQRALTRYYVDAGAGGIAVGVHSTQFQIRDLGLYAPVLELAAETARAWAPSGAAPLLIAGAVGELAQAVAEAEAAKDLGYDFILLRALPGEARSEDDEIERARVVSEILPVIGFYLQSAAGGRRLSSDYWRRLAELPGVAAIKIAPFDRYATLDVLRGVAASSRASEIVLLTGNDDNIVEDLRTRFVWPGAPGVELTFAGGLLGQFGVWTSKATELVQIAQAARSGAPGGEAERYAHAMTDANGVLFDAAHRFRGCLPGIAEVLRRQGLIETNLTLDPAETLSPGQADELDRIAATYPFLHDDEFVAEHRDRWRS